MWIRSPRLPSFTTALATALTLTACTAAAPSASDSPQPLRLLVSTAGDWPDPATFAERAAQLAGVPVSSATVLGPRRFAVSLLCAPGPACDEAQRRLLGNRSVIIDVQADVRRTLPRSPAASQAL